MKKIFLTIAMCFLVKTTFATKVITETICGEGENGYYVTENHDPVNDIHDLNCQSGGGKDCKWKNDPNPSISKWGNVIPSDAVFLNSNGQPVSVDIVAANNAIVNAINIGGSSGTVINNNLTIQWTISLVTGGEELNLIIDVIE